MPTHKNKLVCTSNPSQKVTRQNVQLGVTLDRAIRILRCEGIPQFLSSLIVYPSSGLENVSNPAGSRVAYTSESRQVWVNTATGVYHYPGTRWYGNTKQGKFMSEAEARDHGYRPAKNGQ